MRAAATMLVISIAAAIAMGCGAPGAQPPPAAPTNATSKTVALEDKSGFEGTTLGLYRSDRFGVEIPLPDRSSWTVVDRDDTNGAWLVAKHAATSTVLRMRKYAETSLVGRRECEERALLVGELPGDDVRASQGWETLSDESIHRPKGWDGWRWVAFQPAPNGKLFGHVFLIAGRAHDCLVVHVRAEASGDTQADALADRLEYFASRIVPLISVDRAAEPEMIKPNFPNGAPTAP